MMLAFNVSKVSFYTQALYLWHVCIGDKVKEGDIRLVEGSYLWQGRVEIFLSGVWGTMTDDYADYREASVVCRQLGYSTYSMSYYIPYLDGSHKIILYINR